MNAQQKQKHKHSSNSSDKDTCDDAKKMLATDQPRIKGKSGSSNNSTHTAEGEGPNDVEGNKNNDPVGESKEPEEEHGYIYRDLSRVTTSTSTDGERWREPAPQKLPARLNSMLSDPALASVITWQPHGRAWRILDRDRFTNEVLPAYFDHSNFNSFVRLVNAWGFRRVPCGIDCDCYYHELFLRGMPHLHAKMKRLSLNERKTPIDSKHRCPNFYLLPTLPDSNQNASDDGKGNPDLGHLASQNSSTMDAAANGPSTATATQRNTMIPVSNDHVAPVRSDRNVVLHNPIQNSFPQAYSLSNGGILIQYPDSTRAGVPVAATTATQQPQHYLLQQQLLLNNDPAAMAQFRLLMQQQQHQQHQTLDSNSLPSGLGIYSAMQFTTSPFNYYSFHPSLTLLNQQPPPFNAQPPIPPLLQPAALPVSLPVNNTQAQPAMNVLVSLLHSPAAIPSTMTISSSSQSNNNNNSSNDDTNSNNHASSSQPNTKAEHQYFPNPVKGAGSGSKQQH